MRRKIRVEALVLGMYIDELCGSWMDHPFWKTAFPLNEDKDLKILLKSTVREVWIDTDKGLDVPVPSPAADEEAPALEDLAQDGSQEASSSLVRTEVKRRFEDELARARKVQAHARHAVMAMFDDVRMGKALPLDTVEDLVQQINQTVASNSAALLSLVRLKNKDDYTYLHSVAVCALMLALARQLNLPEQLMSALGMAGLLHDVGKMAVPPDVLNKPGRLSEAEFDIIKNHPMLGWQLLQDSGVTDELVLDVCRHHHERVDGAGYPDKLSGESLSLAARMGAVCDVYDAVTSNRCYKAGWAPAEALRKMATWGGHFDEKVFQAFVKTIGIYPVGTLLKLHSGRLAVVTDQSDKSLLQPLVKVFFSTLANEPIPVQRVDLSLTGEKVVSVEDPQQWQLDLSRIMEC